MKRNELIEVTRYLDQKYAIKNIGRVEDNTIKIDFEPRESIFVDLRRGDSHLFKKDDYKRAKFYNAPFDVLLHKRFSRSKIERFEVVEGNRILRIHVNSSSSYKAQKSILQIEFTGRNTNCIILDENEIILEALRHIDPSISYRSIKTGEKLEPLPAREFDEPEPSMPQGVETFLYEAYEKRASLRLTQIKNQRLITLQKRIERVKNHLGKLEDEKELERKSLMYNTWGTLMFAKLHEIKGYEKEFVLQDFEGNDVKISLPKEAKSPSQGANMLFDWAKKLKRKAKSMHIERESLQEKINFYEKLAMAIKNSKDETELNILMPKQKTSKKANTKAQYYESFYLEGLKIMLGKSENGNIQLLKEAKKSDIWLHLKDIPSSHVIIRTDKQNVPDSVLRFAAKLCVDFSVTQEGAYLVDYTQRRNVKMLEGANVNYVEYKTLSVKKD